MTPWSAFYPLISPEVSGVPMPLMDSALRQTAIDFIRFSGVCVQTTSEVTAAGVKDYDFLLDDGLEVEMFLSVVVGTTALSQTTSEALRSRHTDWDEATGDVVAFYVDQPGVLSLFRVPEVGGSRIVATVKGVPRQNANGLPKWVFERYTQGIADGAKTYLMRMPGVPWENPALADFYNAKYVVARNTARLDSKVNFGVPHKRVRLQAF